MAAHLHDGRAYRVCDQNNVCHAGHCLIFRSFDEERFKNSLMNFNFQNFTRLPLSFSTWTWQFGVKNIQQFIWFFFINDLSVTAGRPSENLKNWFWARGMTGETDNIVSSQNIHQSSWDNVLIVAGTRLTNPSIGLQSWRLCSDSQSAVE